MKRWLVAALLGLAGMASAAIDTYQFKDDAQRVRYRELTKALRCPMCQNQDIADSDAPIAADLRKEVFRLLGEGKNNQQIIDYMVARYGEFVRYKPGLNARTVLLWFGPFGLLLGGGVIIATIVRRGSRRLADSLRPEERERLEHLLDEHQP
ncbi:cytochrome c-type biogenesis protein [Pseudomonas sp. zfem004]|uniref:cytochrome c-type biogenesis protein n=1 Tax=Pseudomonas sp. zfem004 TaxID=3078199 RepID=UPI0029279F93|nr:cytochrome c-type biogenesis protein [Pseudomonas sp. zfem004]MDU9404183.1 cytochrome c-type biogenesis protein [Pseudomonas sp. zfem004]